MVIVRYISKCLGYVINKIKTSQVTYGIDAGF